MIARTLAVCAVALVSEACLADCTVNIQVGDSLSFDTTEIQIPTTCDTVTVNLAHTGSLPVQAMGHNWVLATDENWQAVAAAGAAAGFEGQFVPQDDDRVIAATKLVGGGESDSITFSTSDLDTDASYTFFCSFPGHWSVMMGSLEFI
ncbi:MAG: azurin [Pseudomonadota bacterium]